MHNMSIFCSVNAGINCCQICNNDAYYCIKKKNCKAMGLPVMELFRCGHGMCETCYTSMVGLHDKFKCPFCRDIGRVYKCRDDGAKESHTFRQYRDEFSHSPELMKYSQHVYVKLHMHIVGMWNMEQRAIKDAGIKAMRLKVDRERAKEKALSRDRAVCNVCKKDTFTSERQLWLHMKAKHPVKEL